MDFSGKTILVTGASSGIGKALCKELVSEGAKVIGIARSTDKLLELQKELNLQIYSLDISKSEEIEKFKQEFLKDQKLDMLINNAGVAVCNYFESISNKDFESTMQTNYFGSVFMTKILLPNLKKAQGSVVFISSMASAVGFIGYSAYAPSKFAINGFAEALRNELRKFKMRVHLVLPADTNTPQLTHENRTKPKETAAISGNIKALEPEMVAKRILQGISKNKFLIFTDFMSKISYWFIRICPFLAYKIIDGKVK